VSGIAGWEENNNNHVIRLSFSSCRCCIAIVVIVVMEQYDFDADEQWITYRNNLVIPPDVDEARVIDRYKRKWYQAKFGTSDTTTHQPQPQATTSSQPQQQQQQQQPQQQPQQQTRSTSAAQGQAQPFWKQLLPRLWLVASITMVLNIVLYLLPLASYLLPYEGVSSSACYYRALKSAVVVYAVCLLAKGVCCDCYIHATGRSMTDAVCYQTNSYQR
jgi:hypothetical protein